MESFYSAYKLLCQRNLYCIWHKSVFFLEEVSGSNKYILASKKSYKLGSLVLSMWSVASVYEFGSPNVLKWLQAV